MAFDTLLKNVRVVRPGGAGPENLDSGLADDGNVVGPANGRYLSRPTQLGA